MRKINFILSALAITGLLALNPNASHAQNQPSSSQSRSDMLKSNLGINDEQVAKVRAIEEESNQKMKSARQNANGDKEAMHTQMQAIRQEKETKLSGILNAEQMSKYKAMEAQRRSQHRGGNQQGGKTNE